MKLSKYFYVTLRETPSDATMPSHIFLMRGGYIKPLSTGIYSMMPMGFRVIQKITNIIREEMNHRQVHFDTANLVHFFADDVRNLLDHAEAHRHHGVDTGRDRKSVV